MGSIEEVSLLEAIEKIIYILAAVRWKMCCRRLSFFQTFRSPPGRASSLAETLGLQLVIWRGMQRRTPWGSRIPPSIYLSLTPVGGCLSLHGDALRSSSADGILLAQAFFISQDPRRLESFWRSRRSEDVRTLTRGIGKNISVY